MNSHHIFLNARWKRFWSEPPYGYPLKRLMRKENAQTFLEMQCAWQKKMDIHTTEENRVLGDILHVLEHQWSTCHFFPPSSCLMAAKLWKDESQMAEGILNQRNSDWFWQPDLSQRTKVQSTVVALGPAWAACQETDPQPTMSPAQDEAYQSHSLSLPHPTHNFITMLSDSVTAQILTKCVVNKWGFTDTHVSSHTRTQAYGHPYACARTQPPTHPRPSARAH